MEELKQALKYAEETIERLQEENQKLNKLLDNATLRLGKRMREAVKDYKQKVLDLIDERYRWLKHQIDVKRDETDLPLVDLAKEAIWLEELKQKLKTAERSKNKNANRI